MFIETIYFTVVYVSNKKSLSSYVIGKALQRPSTHTATRMAGIGIQAESTIDTDVPPRRDRRD